MFNKSNLLAAQLGLGELLLDRLLLLGSLHDFNLHTAEAFFEDEILLHDRLVHAGTFLDPQLVAEGEHALCGWHPGGHLPIDEVF